MSDGSPRPPRRLAAYELYLKGLYAGHLETREGCEEAFRCFDLATQEDPAFSLAYSGWAHAYVVGAGLFFPSGPALRRARELATLALEIDPELAEGHKVLGEIAMRESHDWGRAEAELRVAIALNPGDPETHLAYAMLLAAVRRNDEATEEVEMAIQAAPGSVHAWESLIELRYRSGALEAATVLAEEVRDRTPNAFPGQWWTGFCYWATGRTTEARRQLSELAGPAKPSNRISRAVLAGLLGQREEALRLIRELEREAQNQFVPLVGMASLYGVLGDSEKSLELLERDLHEGDRLLWKEYALPQFDGVRSDPRFTALLEEYHLPHPPRDPTSPGAGTEAGGAPAPT